MIDKNGVLQFLSSHKAEFERDFGVRRIGLFGSLARGEASEASDIDIAVEMDSSFLLYVRLLERLEKELGAQIDLVSLHERTKERFKNRVLREGIFV